MTDADLLAYLDESLSAADMASVEQALRGDTELGERLLELVQRRNAGVHSLGEIWRRHRLSCPDRSRLVSFLLGVLGDDEVKHIHFHLEVTGCRFCQANLEDLRSSAVDANSAAEPRQRRLYESTIGRIGKRN
ncbi:MAG TPA: hypothetical protein VHV77_04620 [Pirellulales bacterium]|nr:hypothetical protein [Pirellulales bacterium]